MKKTIRCLLPLFLILGLFCNANAADTIFDLSTPDRAIQSFLAATKANDITAVEAMLSPRIKQLISSGELSIQEYVKAWTLYPIVKIGKARDSSFQNDTRNLASADIVIVVNGKEHGTSVELIKIGGQWLWNEK